MLAAKYLRAGRALEERCDAEFENLMRQLETDLNAHGLPAGLAREARAEYQARKDKRQDELLETARRFAEK